MAAITEAQFEALHPKITINATTEPSSTDFTEWITWAEGKMMTYLQCGSTLPTDIGNILKNVADDLLFRRYLFEKTVDRQDPFEQLRMRNESSPIELTPLNKMDLDSFKGQSSGGEVCAFNFDLDTTEGGFD